MKSKEICKKCIHFEECEKDEHIENYLMNSGCISFEKRVNYTDMILIGINIPLGLLVIYLLIKFLTL